MISFPKCCSPIPGDKIIGYITKGKGVSVHRTNCSNVPLKQSRARFIDVEGDLKGPKMLELNKMRGAAADNIAKRVSC